jgi:hypothetical protein
MSTRILTTMFCASVFVAAVSSAEARQAQSPPPSQAKPEAKPEAKTESSLAGKWNLSIQGPNGTLESGLDLKVDGKKLAGMITSQMGDAKIEGEIAADGKLTFWFTMDANGQSLNITFTGTQQKDGTLAGTFNFGQGDMTWTGTRAKN